LQRQFPDFKVEKNAPRRAGSRNIIVPIVMAKRSGGKETWIALGSPIAPDVPAIQELRELPADAASRIICVDDLLVRRNLPSAVKVLRDTLP
jgi:hypothetical protein